MSVILLLNESTASRRVVPLPPLVQSNGTSACTNESGRTFFFSVGGVDYGSGGSLSAISANAGLYSCNFSASKISVLGQGFVYYSSGTALPASTPIHVVPYDSHDSMRLGLFALPNAAANASGGLPAIGNDYGSSLTVGVSNIKAGTYSGVTVGINNIAAGSYSGATVGTGNIAPGTYSGVTVGTNNIAAGSYSGVTIQGLSNYGNLPAVSIAAGSYSGVTIQGVSNYANLPNVTIANGLYSAVTVRVDPQAYSGMTVGINNIAPNNYSGASVEILTGGIQSTSFGVNAVDAAALATSAGQEIADRVLLRALASGSDTGRTVQDALRPLRNRVAISGSTGTVYQEDDSTSAWTFSVTTVTAVGISDLNPAG